MIGGRYVPGLCWGGFVRVVPGTRNVGGHRAGDTFGEGAAGLRGMVLSLAPGCRVTVRFGRIRIVHFLQGITELPGCVRWLSGCRSGRDSVFRAGWNVNQGRFYGGWRRTRVTRGCPPVNHLGVLMLLTAHLRVDAESQSGDPNVLSPSDDTV
jgi:hypothetical protein